MQILYEQYDCDSVIRSYFNCPLHIYEQNAKWDFSCSLTISLRSRTSPKIPRIYGLFFQSLPKSGQLDPGMISLSTSILYTLKKGVTEVMSHKFRGNASFSSSSYPMWNDSSWGILKVHGGMEQWCGLYSQCLAKQEWVSCGLWMCVYSKDSLVWTILKVSCT